MKQAEFWARLPLLFGHSKGRSEHYERSTAK
jgi:hypothetical protein